ncbi:YncE family protein [Arthrobacter sp. SA17]
MRSNPFVPGKAPHRRARSGENHAYKSQEIHVIPQCRRNDCRAGGPVAHRTRYVGSTPCVEQGSSVIDLPEASGAEGIAAGKGTTFFAGDLVTGDIYRGDIRTGTAEEFITAPEGRAAVGMKVDVKNDLLFVAGGGTGQAYVYDLQTGDTVATYQLVPAGTGFINDVTLTHDGAWFTNSAEGSLYFVPVSNQGVPGTLEVLP